MNPPRNSGLAKLFSSSGIYLLAGVGQQAVGFLLLPLYTSVLSPADYGVLEILNTTGLIVLMLLTFGLPSAITKCYHRDCESESDRKSILATSLTIGFPVLAAGCLVLFLSADWLTGVLLGADHSTNLVRLMVLWTFLTGISGILSALFRAREEAFLMGTVALGTFSLLLLLNLYFVLVLELGVVGVLWGNCISTALAIAASTLLLKGKAIPHVNVRLIRPLMAFGVLVAPAALCGWIMGMADRYFLQYFGHLAVVGIYSLGYKLGMVLEVLIVSPFQLAWPPFAFAISNSQGHQGVYARTLTYLMLVSTTCVLGLTMFSPTLLRLMAHPDYFESHRVVPLIGMAYAFNGIHYCVSPGIHLRQKTRWLPVVVAGAAATNFALNLLLIPKFGMMGAAWATTVSFAVLALATFGVAQFLYPVSYEYRRLAKIIATGVACYGVSAWLPLEQTLGNVVLDLLLLAVGYPLLLLASGFLDLDEKRTIRRLLRSVFVNLKTTAENPEISVRSNLDA